MAVRKKTGRRKKIRQQEEAEVRRIRSIRKLEKTGIVDFFREVQEAGILKSNTRPVYEHIEVKGIFGTRGESVKIADFCQAQIHFADDGSGVELRFNYGQGSYFDNVYETWSSIVVTLGENDGELLIDGEKLPKGQDLISVVTEKVFLRAR